MIWELGKTLQTISPSWPVSQKETKILILAPSSLIYNWKQEFSKFAPQMEVAVVYGLKQHRDELIATNPQVVITSYASFVKMWRNTRRISMSTDSRWSLGHEKCPNQDCPNTYVALRFAHVFASIWDTDWKSCGWTPGPFSKLSFQGSSQLKREFPKLSPETIARFVKPFVTRRKKMKCSKNYRTWLKQPIT